MVNIPHIYIYMFQTTNQVLIYLITCCIDCISKFFGWPTLDYPFINDALIHSLRTCMESIDCPWYIHFSISYPANHVISFQYISCKSYYIISVYHILQIKYDKNVLIYYHWLVVDLPLWKIWVRQLGSLFPTEWKVIQNSMVPVTTNQYISIISNQLYHINSVYHFSISYPAKHIIYLIYYKHVLIYWDIISYQFSKKNLVLSGSSTSSPPSAPGTPICGLVSGEVPVALENPPGGAPGGAMGEGFSPSTGG